jgi:tRNA (guanine-N7-)-methyltransferase
MPAQRVPCTAGAVASLHPRAAKPAKWAAGFRSGNVLDTQNPWIRPDSVFFEWGGRQNALEHGPMAVAVEASIDALQQRSPYADAPRLPAGDALGAEQILGHVPGSVPGSVSGHVQGNVSGHVQGNAAAGQRGLELEIGPGRGGFILERLASDPDVCIVGLEIRLKWASLVDERVRSLGYGARGRVFAEDIRQALPRLLPGSLARVFIHFPDPWWKKRHAKRRLAHPEVMVPLACALAPGGELFVQTDVWDTAQAYREAVEQRPEFEPYGEAPGCPLLSDNPYGARSPRERRVMADGMPVLRLRYRRRAGAAA